jgi:hypothetical protein
MGICEGENDLTYFTSSLDCVLYLEYVFILVIA